MNLELLAPAKNLEVGRLAVLAGADAIYIGSPDFSARAEAGNSWEDIEALINFAHQYYVKVYIALNTIFFDNEISAIQKAIDKAWEIGADALIIQDMGILEMDLPPLPLFASTQADNYNLEQIKFLEKAGFSRVILARELSLEQIETIKEKTKIDLEFFVHGALCVSFSGHCYFSQAVAGRSANRGHCLQACRWPFSLVDANGKEIVSDKYLLSLKDFNLSTELSKLITAGITSFKIEGRLKDGPYVANVVAKYRQELDKIISASEGKYKRASSGQNEFSFTPDLNKTFNRGYTDYFLNGRQSDIISPDSQKSKGELIGRVERVGHNYFSLDRNNDLKNAEGICWINYCEELEGVNINFVKDEKVYTHNNILPERGALIYRNSNPSFEKEIERGVRRSVAVDFCIKEKNKQLAIEATDEDGNKAELKIAESLEAAENPELAEKKWREQLAKLGETVFQAREISFAWKKAVFAPLSVLNEWRREISAALLAERLKNYPRREIKYKKTAHKYPQEKLDYSSNVANRLAKDFYMRHGAEVVEEAFEKLKDIKGKKIMTTKHCLKYYLGACPQVNKVKLLDFKEPLSLVNNGKKYPLKFNCADCEMEIYNYSKEV